MFDDFHKVGMKVVPNLKPWLLKESHPAYETLAEAGGFLCNGTEPFYATYVFNFEFQCSYIDFSSVAGANWWKSSLKQQVLELGADGAWNDNNEYEVFNDGFTTCELNPTPVRTVGRALQPLLMARASFDAISELRPEKRPFVVSRSGALGSHRYCSQTCFGDNVSSWHSLKWNIPMSLSLGLSGWVGNGMDIGGFAGGQPSPELLLRWTQVGVLMPRFSIHSCSLDTTNTPWMYPRMLPAMRDAIRWRYRLIPMLASLYFESATGTYRLPVTRPLALHYATDKDRRSREESFEYLLGRDLLVAPVLEPGETKRDVYLPGGYVFIMNFKFIFFSYEILY
eukprot:GSMAST32.ASY1.ANO1.1748.1 assembled CDS